MNVTITAELEAKYLGGVILTAEDWDKVQAVLCAAETVVSVGDVTADLVSTLAAARSAQTCKIEVESLITEVEVHVIHVTYGDNRIYQIVGDLRISEDEDNHEVTRIVETHLSFNTNGVIRRVQSDPEAACSYFYTEAHADVVVLLAAIKEVLRAEGVEVKIVDETNTIAVGGIAS